MSNGRCQCGAYTDSSSGLCDDCIGRGQVFNSSGFVGFADELAKGACDCGEVECLICGRDEQRTIAAQASALAEAQEEIERLTINLKSLVDAESGYRQSERLALRRLSDAFTGGNASTWEEIFHAAERAEQSLRETENDKVIAQEAAAQWRDELAKAKVSLRENDEERTRTLDAIKGFAGGWFGFGVVTLTEAVEGIIREAEARQQRIAQLKASLREKDAEIARLMGEWKWHAERAEVSAERERTLREALEEITDSIPERYPSPTDAYVQMLHIARAALSTQGGETGPRPAGAQE